jgi:predicted methyltransferase
MTSCLSVLARRSAVVAAVVVLSACAEMKQATEVLGPQPPDYTWLIANPDRSDSDRSLDQRRQPEKLLQFYGVRAGMRVLDMSAGRGYNTELLARVVGPTGRVYAQNQASFGGAGKAAFDDRMKNPVNKIVTPVLRDFDDPIPAEVRNLDLVTFNFNYHDTVYMGVDRAKLNRAVFQALKPGGVYIVADHSAKPGAGPDVTKTLHRIEESMVRKEVEAAGFKLAASGDFLRNPDDPRDTPVTKNPVRNDEFVLKFVKP